MPSEEEFKKLAAEAADQRLKALGDEAERGGRDIYIADHLPIKRFFYAAKTMLQQARTLASEQDLERAYVLLVRFSTFFLEVLPAHGSFKSAAVTADRRELTKECGRTMEEAALLKDVLRSRYLADDEARIRAEVAARLQAAAEARAAAEAQAAAKAAAEAAAAEAARAAEAAAEAERVAEAERKASAEAAEVAAAVAAVEEFEREQNASRAKALLAQAKAAEAAAAERAAAEVAAAKAAAAAAWSAPVCGACDDEPDSYLSLPPPAYPGDMASNGGDGAAPAAAASAAQAAAGGYAPRTAAPPLVPPSQPAAQPPLATPTAQPLTVPPVTRPSVPVGLPLGDAPPPAYPAPSFQPPPVTAPGAPVAALPTRDLEALKLHPRGTPPVGSAPASLAVPPVVPPVVPPSSALGGTAAAAAAAAMGAMPPGTRPVAALGSGAVPPVGPGSSCCAPPPFSWDPTKTVTPPSGRAAGAGAPTPGGLRSSGSGGAAAAALLRPLLIPETLISTFTRIAATNTARNIETCGILLGTVVNGELRTDRLLVPTQTGTSDTCTTTDEDEIWEYCAGQNACTFGWIHTHPTQTCFLSSMDLHTHCGYQSVLDEAVAIVLSPSHTPSQGVFRLSHPDPPGLRELQRCRKHGFHPDHQRNGQDAGNGVYEHSSHIRWTQAPIQVVDLRKHK